MSLTGEVGLRALADLVSLTVPYFGVAANMIDMPSESSCRLLTPSLH